MKNFIYERVRRKYNFDEFFLNIKKKIDTINVLVVYSYLSHK